MSSMKRIAAHRHAEFTGKIEDLVSIIRVKTRYLIFLMVNGPAHRSSVTLVHANLPADRRDCARGSIKQRAA